jgi:hypothetical protein
MSTTTISLTTLVAGTANDPADVNANFNAIKTAIETTKFGFGNMLAKYTRFTICANEYVGIPDNPVNLVFFRGVVPAGMEWIIEEVSVSIESWTLVVADPTIELRVDEGGGAGYVQRGSVLMGAGAWADPVTFVCSPATLNGGDKFYLAINGNSNLIVGLAAAVTIRQILQEA